MDREIHILCLEDSTADVVMINHALRVSGLHFRTKRVDTREAFLEQLESNPPDVILSDQGLPSFDGTRALILAREKFPRMPFIFVSGSLNEQKVTELVRLGATEFVCKNQLARLAPAVQRALSEAEARARLKQKEEQLRECEERYRMLIGNVKDYAIYMLDAEGRVTTWTDGAQAIEGYTTAEILGKHLSTFFTPEDVKRGLPGRLLKVAAADGRTINEGWRVRKDGSRFWSYGVLTALRDEKGGLRGYSKIAHDLTKQKQSDEEIRQLNEQLERRVRERTADLQQANEELEAFGYSVSHDLRAPLRHITGYAQLLLTQPALNLDETSRQYLQTIANSAINLGRLIDALLALSRLGRAELNPQPVNLADLVEEARNELRHEMEGRADIDWEIGKLPVVEGDPVMLRQVMVNLLSNAVKYTRTRARARIEIGATESEKDITVHIRDNGVGFDSEHADKLFGVFQRMHSASEFEGIGVGLANVWRIIRRHGGRVWADAAVDRGATFYFSLPKQQKGQL